MPVVGLLHHPVRRPCNDKNLVVSLHKEWKVRVFLFRGSHVCDVRGEIRCGEWWGRKRQQKIMGCAKIDEHENELFG